MKLSYFFLGQTLASGVERYDGDKVFKFKNLTNGAIQHLKTADKIFNGFDFWQPEAPELLQPGGGADIHVSAQDVESFWALLEENDIDFGIMTHNLQHDIDAEKEEMTRSGRAHSLTNYNDFDTIRTWFQEQGQDSRANYVEFGTTHEGRKMFSLEIGSGSKVISIDCGIHAREWISPAYCQWFVNEALNGKFSSYLNQVKFLVQPVLNPDGYAHTHSSSRMWRKNRSPQGACFGVDLNRNYDANFGGPGSSGQACSETFRGRSVFSEKESAAQRDYLDSYFKNQSLKAFITIHSYGQYILYPYSYDYTSVAPNKSELDSVGANMRNAIFAVDRKSYTMGQGTNVLYPAAGGSDDWALDVMLANNNRGPLSYTYELRDTGTYGFVLPANQIEPNCLEMDAGMDVLINYVVNNK